MKNSRDLDQKTDRDSFLCNTEVLAVIISLVILLIVDLGLTYVFWQIPDRIAAIRDPDSGDYISSMKTETFILADVIFFVILFLITHEILIRLKRRF
jgi:hypothetical protein